MVLGSLNRIVFPATTLNEIFSNLFFFGPAATVPPMKIDLTAEARLVRVCLKNYSQEKKNSM